MGLEQSGFEIVPEVISEARCDELASRVSRCLAGRAGSRSILENAWCRQLANDLAEEPRIQSMLRSRAVCVQCTYFDKSPDANWLVAYHQDLTIAVLRRVESNLCSGWSMKQGIVFVQPPTPVLEALLAVRVYLDESNDGNGPLRVIKGSHIHGHIRAGDIAAVRDRSEEIACMVPRGGALVLKPLLLHASSKSTTSQPRRVLHFLFGPADLPEGLAWRTAVQLRAR